MFWLLYDVTIHRNDFFFNNCLISLRLPIPTSAKIYLNASSFLFPLKIAWDINRIDRCLKPCLLRESAERSSISYYLILNFARNFAAFFLINDQLSESSRPNSHKSASCSSHNYNDNESLKRLVGSKNRYKN